jgi:hypothetical protein
MRNSSGALSSETEELAHAKEQFLRMLAFAHREDLLPESSMFPHY